MQQDRREVEQQQVLDHVHDEQLLAQAVDGRDERDEHEREAAEEAGRRQPAPGRCRPRGARARQRRT